MHRFRIWHSTNLIRQNSQCARNSCEQICTPMYHFNQCSNIYVQFSMHKFNELQSEICVLSTSNTRQVNVWSASTTTKWHRTAVLWWQHVLQWRTLTHYVTSKNTTKFPVAAVTASNFAVTKVFFCSQKKKNSKEYCVLCTFSIVYFFLRVM